MEEKTCSACKSVLPLSEFHQYKNGKFGKANVCKPCARQRALNHYHANKTTPYGEDRREYLRGKRYEYKYGISIEKYHEMLEAQGGVCAICGGDSAGKGTFSVDHCHETKAVRGLLCQPCNLMLGQARDDVSRLQAAIDYLSK